ncbi:maleylpyruvate isomerase family mycothiol-dependent enzyme [Nocardioides taihuensis]|uniref:Maleylpyruvate isomerase family mycothiol-dependent enzyme n=1 Tax=Nocardioides taihuensis TaxID=1835606 RepID=A0ABW0BRT3_9ACTN
MTPLLSPASYLDHLRRESARFRDVLAGCDPAARVPGCPEWDAADLLWHLAEVQWFWGTTVRTRPADADEDAEGPDRPATHDGLLAAYDEWSAALAEELAGADPGDACWTWSQDHTVAFVLRRQAHEAMVHRLDAEQAAGAVTPLPADLAADGVLECLDVMFGGEPSWGSFTPGDQHVRIDCTDTGDSVWVVLGRFAGTDPRDGQVYDDVDVHAVPDPGTDPAVVVSGPAAALVTWLWRRGDDAEVTVSGDPATYGAFRSAVNHPIN